MRYAAELPTETASQVWVFSDSLKAVQALSQPGKAQIGRECVRRTTQMITERQHQQQQQQQQQQHHQWITIAWIPGHSGIHGNEKANAEAQSMTVLGMKPIVDTALRVRELKQV